MDTPINIYSRSALKRQRRRQQIAAADVLGTIDASRDDAECKQAEQWAVRQVRHENLDARSEAAERFQKADALQAAPGVKDRARQVRSLRFDGLALVNLQERAGVNF